LANVLFLLLTHPRIYQAVLADNSLIPRAIAETLRVEGTVQFVLRIAVADFALAGVHVPAGSRVPLMCGAANETRLISMIRCRCHWIAPTL
jgi:cytochrome P450